MKNLLWHNRFLHSLALVHLFSSALPIFISTIFYQISPCSRFSFSYCYLETVGTDQLASVSYRKECYRHFKRDISKASKWHMIRCALHETLFWTDVACYLLTYHARMAYMTCRRTRPTMVDRSAKRRRVLDVPAIPTEPRWAARECLGARALEIVDLPSKGGCLGGSPGKTMKLQIRVDPSLGDLAARQAGASSLPRGLVGLTNQKSNCYANSIVQMLYLCRLYATLLIRIYIF